MERYRSIIPFRTYTLIRSAYVCANENAARQIIAVAVENGRPQPITLVAEDRREIIVASPETRSTVLSEEICGSPARWQRLISMNLDDREHRTVALVLDGKLSFRPDRENRQAERKQKDKVRWHLALRRLPVDGFVAWEYSEDDTLRREIDAIYRNADGRDKEHLTLHAGTTLKGAAISRFLAYDTAGEPKAIATQIFLIDLRVHVRRSRLSIISERHSVTSPLNEVERNLPPGSEFIESVWTPLLVQAFDGFKKTCKIECDETAAFRSLLLDQFSKEEHEESLNGSGYGSRVEAMDWQAALETVEEPWQLGVVIDLHGATFANDTKRTYAEVVAQMIMDHACSDDRRATLQRMVDTYLEPVTDGWGKPFLD